MQHTLSTKQFLDTTLLDSIFATAHDLEKRLASGEIIESLRGKVLATLFYEPSTRTRFSFETAMIRLGGQVITTENARDFSSAVKGETIEDTVRVVGNYADAIVLRHPENGTALKASLASPAPIINAGDGSGEHPTQALLDLYTIHKELGRIDGLTIGLVGDLLYGRTIHSLLNLLSVFQNITIYLISPASLQVPEEYKQLLQEKNIHFTECATIDEALPHLDVLYMTRIQKERFASLELYNDVKDSFMIDAQTLQQLPQTAIIMHPLPRVNEIALDVDTDPRAAYFRQAGNGLFVRMALLQMTIGKQ